MKDAKPILWIKAPQKAIKHLELMVEKTKEDLVDYYVFWTYHDIDECEFQVLNGEELTEEKYNALMEALKK